MFWIPLLDGEFITHSKITICTYRIQILYGYIATLIRWDIMSAMETIHIQSVRAPFNIALMLEHFSESLYPHLLSHSSRYWWHIYNTLLQLFNFFEHNKQSPLYSPGKWLWYNAGISLRRKGTTKSLCILHTVFCRQQALRVHFFLSRVTALQTYWGLHSSMSELSMSFWIWFIISVFILQVYSFNIILYETNTMC